MAQNQANFGLNFRVDKSGLNELKKSLQDIMKLGQQNNATGDMKKQLEEACKAARQLETILDGAWNSKLGQLNLDKVNQGINTTFKSVGQLRDALEGSGKIGTSAYNKMASQILSTNLQLKQSNKLLDDMATSMANTVKWGITSSIFNNMTRSVQDAFYYVKNLDSSLNDIRIVTGASADQMAAFAEKANTAAKALGQSTRAYTDASLIYYQQGLSEQDVAARAETTLKAANVTGQNTEQVSELLTSVWNGYKVSAAEAELYIDKIAAVAATTASDLEELSVGMSKVASAASLMGVDIDQLNAQLATIVSVTRQAPESVGTALKTIYARMGDIEAGLDGETTLGNYTEQMKEMGFNVLDAQGKLRDMGSVIEEIGAKWGDMTREQQLSLAQTVAGTRQYNNLLALFDNWDMYTGALNTSATAMGTLQKQQDIYMESTKAHLQQLSTEAERTYSTLLNTDVINGVTDALTGVLGQFNDFIEGLGGGGQALLNFGAIAARVFDKQIANSILRMQQNLETVKINKAADEAKTKILEDETKRQNQISNADIDAESAGFKAQVEAAREVHAIRNSLTQEQYQETLEIQKQIALETNKLETLKEQQLAAQDFTEEQRYYKDLSSSFDDDIQDQIDREKEKNKELENSIQALLEIKNLMLDIQSLQEDEDSDLLKDSIEKKKAELEKRAVELEDKLVDGFANAPEYGDAYDNLLGLSEKTDNLQSEDFEEINAAIKGSRQAQEEHNKKIEAGNSILKKRHTDLTGEIQASEKIIDNLKTQNKEYVAIGEKVAKVVKNVQTWATIGQVLTSIGGGLSVIFDEASTGADKANAAFQMLVNSASAFGPYGMVAAGLLTIAKAGLEAAGAWDWVEDKFKSTAEKLAEINKATSENNLLTQQTNQQVASIKEVEEEYKNLIDKTDEYGFNLDRMTEEEKARYHELTNTFAQYNDAIILGYDEQGNAIVNNQNAIKDTIKLLKDEAEQRARNNLGNVSDKLKTYDKNIKEAEEDKTKLEFDASEYGVWSKKARETGNFDAEESKLVNMLTGYKRYLDVLDEEIQTQTTQINNMSVAELTEAAEQLGEDIYQYGMTADYFQQMQDYSEELNKFFQEDYFKDETITTGFIIKKDHLISASENFDNFNNLVLQPSREMAEQYQSTVDQMTVDLEAAENKVQELKNFDTNFLLSVIQYGEGYDQQWDALSDDAQQIGSRLIIDYIENLEYGIVKAEADKSEQGIYETAVTMIQNFVESFGEAFELSGALLHDAIEKANLDEFKGTAVEYKEKIASIIKEVLSQIDQTELQDQETRDALEAYFKNQFSLSDLNIDFDSGEVEDIITSAENAYIETRRKIHKKLQLMNLRPEGGGLTANWLEGILDEDQLGNIDAILDNFDYAGYVKAGQNIDALGVYLKKAAEAAAEAENATAKYNREMQSNKDILEKFANKESLNESEKEYLKTLEQEYPILKRLQRGSEEYSKALETIQEEQTKKYKKGLEQQLEDLKENLKVKKQALNDFDGDKDSEEYAELQQGVLDAESDIQDTEYEMNVILRAEPSIRDQIKSLYDESDTLLTIRTTLEKEEELGDDQTTVLGDFFAAPEGQGYLSEYFNTGIFTEEMLAAAEAFAESKRALAEQSRESLIEEAAELTAAADKLMKQAEDAFNNGHLIDADNKLKEANDLYSQAATTAAKEVQYSSKDEEKEQQDFDTEMESFGLESDEVEDLANSIQDMAESSDELADSLKYDEEAAKEVAKELKRYDKALESVKENYEDWSKALDSDNIELQAEAVDNMDKAYSDLLDLDYGTLSDEFLTNAENLELMKEAANGGTEAYDELASRAQNDILTQCNFDVNDEQAMEDINNLENTIINGIDDIEVGASIDNAQAIAAMNELINMAGMTAEQATNYLASMGVDAEVETVEVPESQKQAFVSAIPNITYEDATAPAILPDGGTEDVPIQVPKITYDPSVQTESAEGTKKATALRVTSANKSSGGGFKHSNSKAGGSPSGGKGGGGKGGGGKGSAPKKTKARKKDYYHNVNNSLTKLGNQYEKLAEQQDKTFGQKHINNIKKTNENLDKQIAKMRERIKIANEQEKKDLKKDITKNYKDVKFNKDGTIKNYEEVLAKYYKKYQNAKSQEAQDKAKEKYDELKELLDNYETLILETIPNWEAEVREKIDEKYENMVHQFEYEIEMRVNWGDSVREFREFFHEISDYSKDFEDIALFNLDQATSYFDSNEITSRTRQLSDALGELDKINAANAKGYKITNEGEEKFFSDIWGDNKEGLMDYIATLQTDLMDAILNIQDNREDAYDAYLDAIDEGIDKMDRHLEQYEVINEQLEHNRNLVELIYGETSDQLANIYEEQRTAQLEQIKGQKNAADMYYERMIDAQDRLNKETKGTDRYKEIEEEVEQFTDLYNEAVSNVNATVEESIELIISKYEYAVQQIFKNINNDLLNTSVASVTDPLNTLQIGSLEEASLQWDLLNQEAEQYLDATNSTFEVQKLEAKYLDALNQTDNLKAQQKLNDVMNEQISMLEKKDELSQYEVDRANLIYDLTLKQIALEEAQQNKSKMRLRRDAQGNYSYQFTADADLIKQTQQELLDVQQQLYNLDKDNYQSQLNEMYGYYVEWQEKLAEVAMIKDVDERNRTAALVNDYYTKLMQNANDQAQIAKTNLDELVEGPLADFYKANEDIAIGPNGLSSMYESALSVLSEKFAGEDGISNQVQTAWEDISKKAEIYKEELDAIASASGEAFDKLSTDEELNKITEGIGDITTATEALGKEWKTVLDSISEFVNKLDALLKDETIEKAKEVIKESEKVEINELKNAGDAAEKANIAAVADPVPEPTQPTTNDNKDKEDKNDNKNKNTNKTKTIKKGGKINAKGAKIYDAPGGTGKTQYFKNDPKYKVLKISGNWVQARYHKLSSGVSGWFKKSAVKALNTGGYTGDWNSNEGRIALLHKKELVLNQKDTKNILDAVNIIRGLGGLLQNSMISRIEGLTQSLNGISIPTVQNNPETGPQSVEQTVHITAEFPGATEVIQIEQALENLVSRASQYAFRRKE